MSMKTDEQLAAEGALTVRGMDCASCVAHVERAVRKIDGVRDVAVSLARGRATVRFDADRVALDRVATAITDAGYPSSIEAAMTHAEHAGHEAAHAAEHAGAWRRRAIVGVALWAPVEALHWTLTLAGSHAAHGITWMTWLALVTSTASIAFVGGAFYRSAFAALRRGTTNMDTLISMGATVAYGYSLVALVGALAGAWTIPDHVYFTESTALLALISLGHYLETRARDRAGIAIRDLMKLASDTALRLPSEAAPKKRLLSLGVIQPGANAVASDEPVEVPVGELVVGDRVLVRPGDRVPIDGVVERGTSSVDESMLTGEPLPVTRGPGEDVTGGTINRDGALTVRVARVGSETVVAQIVALVENAQNAKPPVQRLADRISAVFVPTVLALSVLVGVGWFTYGVHAGWDARHTWGAIANAVCSVLIVACPCALGIALPAALMVSTGWGARHGILIRNLDAIQRGERVRVVVLDKTGTITEGKPRVDAIEAAPGVDARELLRLAAGAESHSEHPLAEAIVAHAREQGVDVIEPGAFANEPGVGVRATVDGRRVFVGRDGDAGGIAVFADDVRLGTIALVDTTRDDSRAAIARLRAIGVRVVMLTGDVEANARRVAAEVGVDDVISGVRPDGKARAIEDLKAGLAPGDAVVMVGDGVNDAPALAAADLGIAIGTGSDVAKQTAGVVLVGGSLHAAVDAVRLSRITMRTIRQNLFFAFAYNVVMIPLAALGGLTPTWAAAAMMLSDVTVIGNALRIRRSMSASRPVAPAKKPNQIGPVRA